MSWFFLFALEGLAVITDLVKRKIPNILILTGGILGLSLKVISGGLFSLVEGLTGATAAFLVLAFLHYFKMLGAGDIKLLMVTGIFLGPVDLGKQILFTFVVAAVISVAVLLRYGILLQRLRYFFDYMRHYLETGEWVPYIKMEDDRANLHFSIPIFVGSILLRQYLFKGG